MAKKKGHRRTCSNSEFDFRSLSISGKFFFIYIKKKINNKFNILIFLKNKFMLLFEEKLYIKISLFLNILKFKI